jgi:uncharacterized protein (TIGR02996 family)
MGSEAALLAALQADPNDNDLRLVYADWLEERGDQRSELIRLLHTLTRPVGEPDRRALEGRLLDLLAAGVQPIGPFWTNSLGMKFAWVSPGAFLMGSPESEARRGEDETQHPVTLTKGFYLAVHQVTNAAWEEVMGFQTGSFFLESDLPVECSDGSVSWDECQEFLRRLGKRDRQTYRLPTEAEWEYACRAGTSTPFSFGETISTDQANFDGRYPYGKGRTGKFRGEPTPVGSFPPNAFGLYDMHGNVFEWCNDWYGEYPKEAVVDPQGPPTEGEAGGHVVRGGQFDFSAAGIRSANRFREVEAGFHVYAGFRVAITAPSRRGAGSRMASRA